MVTCPLCHEGKLKFDRIEERKGIHCNIETIKERIYTCTKKGCIGQANQKEYESLKELETALGRS